MLPDAYSFGRGGSNGPGNITPPMPGTGNGTLAQGLLGGRFGNMAGGALGRLMMARRKPGLDPYVDPTLSELGQTGPNGEVYDPESLFGVRGHTQNRASLQQLRGYSSALGGWRSRPGALPNSGNGAGFGQPDDILRRLLQARMGGG